MPTLPEGYGKIYRPRAKHYCCQRVASCCQRAVRPEGSMMQPEGSNNVARGWYIFPYPRARWAY